MQEVDVSIMLTVKRIFIVKIIMDNAWRILVFMLNSGSHALLKSVSQDFSASKIILARIAD